MTVRSMQLNPQPEEANMTITDGMQLTVRGKVATLTLNGYKTKYAHASGEYDLSKTEAVVPAGYRPRIQAYGTFSSAKHALLLTSGGQVVMQPTADIAQGYTSYGDVTYLVA